MMRSRAANQLAALIVILIAGSYCSRWPRATFSTRRPTGPMRSSLFSLCAVIFLQCRSRRRAHIAITILGDRCADPARRHLWRSLLAAASAANCFAVFWISASETWVQFRDGALTVATYRDSQVVDIDFHRLGLLSSALYFPTRGARPRFRRHRRRWSRNDMVASDRRRARCCCSCSSLDCRLWSACLNSQSDRLAGADRHSRLRHVAPTVCSRRRPTARSRLCRSSSSWARSCSAPGAMKTLLNSLDRLVGGKFAAGNSSCASCCRPSSGRLSGAAMAVAGLLGHPLFCRPCPFSADSTGACPAGTIIAGACLEPDHSAKRALAWVRRDDRQRLSRLYAHRRHSWAIVLLIGDVP